ncbi:MAG: HAD hydrolase-like protein, partial [Xanthobacteraceae bacterium]
MKYKLVIFDFDGTLADSASWFLGILNDLARRHGFRSVTEAEIEMLRGRGNREIIRYLNV